MEKHALSTSVFAVTSTVLISIMTGCAQPRQTSSLGMSAYKPITPNNESSYELAPGDSATAPVLTIFSAPVYPQNLVSLSLPPVDIMAQLIMNEGGAVVEARFTPYLGNNEHRKEFEASVSKAALTWKFSPLVITKSIPQKNAYDKTVTISEPFSLWYMFHFEVKNEKPTSSVETKARTED